MLAPDIRADAGDGQVGSGRGCRPAVGGASGGVAEAGHRQHDERCRHHRETFVYLAQRRPGDRADRDERDGRASTQCRLTAGRSQPGVCREAGQHGGDDHRRDVLHAHVAGRRRLYPHGQGQRRRHRRAGGRGPHPGHRHAERRGGQNQSDAAQQNRARAAPARRGGAQHPPGNGRADEKGHQRHDRAEHGQPRPACGRHAEDDHVAGHVAPEHVVQAQVSDSVDDARREGEGEHQPQRRHPLPHAHRPAA
jgi:hypothetical protein